MATSFGRTSSSLGESAALMTSAPVRDPNSPACLQTTSRSTGPPPTPGRTSNPLRLSTPPAAWSFARPARPKGDPREHRAAGEPRCNPAAVSLPRRQRRERAAAAAAGAALGAAAVRRRDRDRHSTGPHQPHLRRPVRPAAPDHPGRNKRGPPRRRRPPRPPGRHRPTFRSPSTSPPGCRTSSRPTTRSSTKPPPRWTGPGNSCPRTSPAQNASPHSERRGLIAGNGGRAFHHPVPAHTPGS
jgi:hypothetical protein